MKEILKDIFTKPYQGKSFILDSLLKPLLGDYKPSNEDILHNSERKKLAENANVKAITRIAEFELEDTTLQVFDITLSSHSKIKYSKVNIQKVVRSIMDVYTGAIMFFHYENNEGDWRISFVEKEDSQKNTTSAKRYTFLVGENHPATTITQRFVILSGKEKSVEAIREAFSVEQLTKDFYNDLFKWFSWTLTDEVGITFPNDTRTSNDDKEKLEEKIIRLITRVLFVWFIKHKGLVPNNLFEVEKIKTLLKNFDENSMENGDYYNAILQNLFFATLNKPVGERGFATLKSSRDIKTLYRYAEMFSISENDVLQLFEKIPFLNGGLFECLDKELSTDGIKYHLDGFSRNANKYANGNFSHRAFIPNCVFFGNGKNEGLIPLLNRYNFTIEENSSQETQVSLDPELLGNVFENLLGVFNEETKESARKQSGSFYTPREIVDFMVDESLKSYLNTTENTADEQQFVEILFKNENLSDEEQEILKNKTLCKKISEKLHQVKILDPACGSGAFPMGILSRMVEILDRLDIENQKSHYDLKLHLIEECIYGIDIQSIAAQISKLRFFISLIVEQEQMDFSKENYGVHTLPNLETKFVAANSLVGIQKNIDNENSQIVLRNEEKLRELQKKLLEIRKSHFYAKSKKEKQTLRDEDEKIRFDIVSYLTTIDKEKIDKNKKEIEILRKKRKNYEKENWVEDASSGFQGSLFDEENYKKTLFQKDINQPERDKIDKQIRILRREIAFEENKGLHSSTEDTMKKLAQWNPYDQNASSPFFDMEWMFGVEDGFDIVIGNPPYIQLQKDGGKLAKMYVNQVYQTFARTGDIYSLFYEKGYQILKPKGILAYITSNKWMRAGYGEATRKFFAEKTNPLQLIDFAGIKVFESATVDTNILIFAKENNTFSTRACVVKDKELKKLSDYIKQNGIEGCRFDSSESWVILSEIEQRIKAKIEAVGTPLKDWDIQINYGIKTGFNEAFIINGEKRKELIAQDPKSAEIIRPILRGRDIKRYGYEFADLYLLFIPWHFPLHLAKPEIKGASLEAEKAFENQYPAIYNHLLQYKKELSNRNKAETGIRYEWYALQRWGANYWEDFSKQKIMYSEIVREPQFYLDNKGEFFAEATSFIMTGSNLEYLYHLLHSKTITYFFKTFYAGGGLGGDGYRYKKVFLEKLPVPKDIININNENNIEKVVSQLYKLTEEEINYINSL